MPGTKETVPCAIKMASIWFKQKRAVKVICFRHFTRKVNNLFIQKTNLKRITFRLKICAKAEPKRVTLV